MKKIILIIISIVSLLTTTACKTETDTISYVSLGDIELSSNNEGVVSLSLESSEVKEKYDTLYDAFEGVNLTKIVAGTTSTANILYQMGITPLGAPQSSSLDPELTSLQCTGEIDNVDGCTVGNIGSAIAPNKEVMVSLDADIVVVSSAFASHASTLYEDMDITSFPQSEVVDIFVILQVFQDVDPENAGDVQSTFTSLFNDIQEAMNIVESSDMVNPTAAIIQDNGTSFNAVDNTDVIGSLVYSLGITNTFTESTAGELNQELLISSNPEYIIIYEHADGDKVFESVLDNTTDGVYRTIDAVVYENYFTLDSSFSGSVDLNITKILLQIAKEVYL